MNVNPEDYDPEELRRMAEERRSTDDDRTDPRRNGDGRQNGPSGAAAENGSGTDAAEGGASRFDFGDGPSPRGSTRRREQVRTGRGRAGEALRSNQLEQLFLHQSSMAEGGMTKPYLGGLPQKYAAERVIFDWLEFLVLKGGFKRAMDALRYYRTIDWITDEVEADLQDYLAGFTTGGENTRELDVDDHQLSLVYLARLASMS